MTAVPDLRQLFKATMDELPAPENVQVRLSAKGNRVLSWDAVDGAEDYVIVMGDGEDRWSFATSDTEHVLRPSNHVKFGVSARSGIGVESRTTWAYLLPTQIGDQTPEGRRRAAEKARAADEAAAEMADNASWGEF